MAMVYLLEPNFQVVDESGKPEVGGWIEVRKYNDNSPVITKKDFDGTDNPYKVVLNSLGMATIIVDSAYAYNVFCYNRFGSLKWSRLNIIKESSGGSNVAIVPTISTGTKIADFSIDGNEGSLFAPDGGGGSSEIIRKVYSLSVGDDKALGLVNNGTLTIDNDMISNQEIVIPFNDKRLYTDKNQNIFKVFAEAIRFYLGEESPNIVAGDIWDIDVALGVYDIGQDSIVSQYDLKTIHFKWSTNYFTYYEDLTFLIDHSFDWENAKPVLIFYLGNKANILTANDDKLEIEGYLESAYNYI